MRTGIDRFTLGVRYSIDEIIFVAGFLSKNLSKYLDLGWKGLSCGFWYIDVI